MRDTWLVIAFAVVGSLLQEGTVDGQTIGESATSVSIPRVDSPPRLEEFLLGSPGADRAGQLTRISGFIQRAPADGEPATEQTEVYLGRDDSRLYVIFVASDREPEKLRARLERREGITFDEDQVGLYLDTFNDRRLAYQFETNALGIQDDSLYSEDTGAIDETFDTVWDSKGVLTDRGFVVWMSIPFKSLRFPADGKTWRFAFWRWIPRRAEGSWWPRETLKIRGILSQAAAVEAVDGINGTRNMQLIPYGTWRSFRAVDNRVATQPAYASDAADANLGLDAKVILKDSLVIDVTANPDFAQVESDEPQTVVNQRFEVFFPERRPFFTENSSYFDVPMVGSNRLLFTRRISHPDLGARLTGKAGPYSVGALFADDRAPGETAVPGSPSEGQRAYFGVIRVSRGFQNQSNVGAMFTDRSFNGSFNRVLDLDATARLGKTWTAAATVAASSTSQPGGSIANGHDFDGQVKREGRGFNFKLNYVDISPTFQAQAGFIKRTDVRTIVQDASYSFWPKGSWVTKANAELFADGGWDFQGTRLFWDANPSLSVEIKHQTTLKAYTWRFAEGIRPKDYPVLTQDKQFDREGAFGVSLSSRHVRFISFDVMYESGTRVHYIPPAGHSPVLADYRRATAGTSLWLPHGLTIANTYLFDENRSQGDGATMYDSHIVRSKWNWQISRELSFRLIAQYNGLITNPLLTSTPMSKNLTTDLLATYLVHPGTALYVGYTSDLRNPLLLGNGSYAERFGNDGRQLFVKVSYLFRL